MTETSTSTPRVLERTGRYPGVVVAVQVGRKAGRSGLLWGLIFAFYVVAQTLAYTSAYKTQAARDQLTRAFGTNIGVNALIGPARAINTVAGYASWRVLGTLSVLGAIWGLLTSTRLLRGDEEAGRYELLLTGQTTRRRGGLQTVAGLAVGLVTLFVLTAIGTVVTGRAAAVGFTLGQSVYFSITIVAGAAIFLAIGALTSQLADTRRRAAAIAGTVFGIFYALRMVADSDPGVHWIVWLSPLGWIEESRPLTDPRPLALLPVALLVLLVTTAAVQLAAVRDVGDGVLAGHDSAPPHLRLAGGPTGLAIRLMRPMVLGWTLAVAAFALLLGSVAESAAKGGTGEKSVQQALSRLGGHASPVAAYLGLTFLILALMIALIAAGQIAAIRTEEADGHLENLLVRPVSRTAWFAGRMVLCVTVLVGAGVLAGIGSWAGAAGRHGTVAFGSLVAAGLNVVPPSLFLLGLGALTLGAWPRRTSAVVYGYLAWSFLIEFIGAVVHASHWLLDTSMFFHMAPAPATSPDLTSAAVLTGLGVLGTVVGAVLLNRRDVIGA